MAMKKEAGPTTSENPRVGGCWCNVFEENMWRKDVCVSCFHKKSDHTNAVGICNFRKPPATKAAQAEEAKKAVSSSPPGSAIFSSTPSSSSSSLLDPPATSNKRTAVQISASSTVAAPIAASAATSSPTTRRPSNAASINSAPSSSSSLSSSSSSSSPAPSSLTPLSSHTPSKSFVQPRVTRPLSHTASTGSTSNVRLASVTLSSTAPAPSPSPSPQRPLSHTISAPSSPPAPRNVTSSALSVLQRYPYSQAQQTPPSQTTTSKSHKMTPSQSTQTPSLSAPATTLTSISTSTTTTSTSNSTSTSTSTPISTTPNKLMPQTKSLPYRNSKSVSVGANLDPKATLQQVIPLHPHLEAPSPVPEPLLSPSESPELSEPAPEALEVDGHEVPGKQVRYRDHSPPLQRHDTAPDAPQRGPSFSELYTEPAQQALQPPPKLKRKSVLPPSQINENLLSASGAAAAQGQEPVEMCIRLMRQLFEVLDLNLEEKYMKEFWIKAETDIRNKKENRHWLSPNTLRLMESMRAEVDTFVDHQKRIQMIIVMQSFVRAKLARRKVTQLREYLLTPHKERNALFRELIKSERMYISRLSLMVKGYMQPLKSTKLLSFSHILPIDDIAAIFSNSEVLLKVHTGILGEFEMLLDQWPVIELIGSVFLRKAPELKGYGEYVKNFKTALDTLIRSQENNQKFAQFLAERGVASDDPGLMALISCPLNQISQYEILLERLSKATPTWHPDSAHLSAATQIMRETYKLIQDAINQSHDRAKILDVQRRLMPGQLDQELASVVDRVFITEGTVSVVEKKMKRNRYYFLFNDTLLICKQHKNQFKVKVSLTLKDLIIEEFANSQQVPPSFDPLCCCNLIVPKAKVLCLFSSKTEKSDLVLKLRTIVEKLNPNTKVFGLSLVELQKREKASATTVPSILERMAQRIRTDVNVEGVFRISCSNANLLELRDRLEKDDEVDFTRFDVHTVTSAMKLFFREMPEPLLTFLLYDDLLAVADTPSTEARVTALKGLIKKLPKPNYEVLVFVCTFLRFVAQHAAENKMNLNNLAIVFGPNLIKPPVVSIESTLMIPKANSVLDDLLNHLDQIVDLKK